MDRGKLNRMLGPLLPYRQWRTFIENRRPDWLQHFEVNLPDLKQMTLDWEHC
jgi:hypothetical protein